jgi:hypothetical protein
MAQFSPMAHARFGTAFILFLLGSASCAHAQGAQCALKDVRVTDLKASDFGQSATRVVGRLVNTCDAATAAEVRFVFRRADGTEVYAEEVFPAELNNIDAHGELVFEIRVSPRVTGFDRVEANVIRLKRW